MSYENEAIHKLYPNIVTTRGLYPSIVCKDSNGDIVAIDNAAVVAEAILIEKREYKNKIDVAAGEARDRFISRGAGVVEEYRLAASETKEWRDAGSPSGNVPISISSWAIADGMTDGESATAIEDAEVLLTTTLLSIRTIRLSGKSAVEIASSDFDTVAQTYIDQLDAVT